MLFRLVRNGNQATHWTDRADTLQDDVPVLLSDNQGTPVIVRVGEPKSGGLEETTLFSVVIFIVSSTKLSRTVRPISFNDERKD